MNPGEWSLEVGEERFHVTVTPTPNGKGVIRVDGRAIASPMRPDETERIIPVGNE